MFTKFRNNASHQHYKVPYLLNFTQPNMAFTPRQIIEQFASGEVIARENTPTDEFYDDKFTDDELASLVQIEDDFQARQAVIDFQIEQQVNETETSTNLRNGVEENTTPTASTVPIGDGSSNMVDSEPPSA